MSPSSDPDPRHHVIRKRKWRGREISMYAEWKKPEKEGRNVCIFWSWKSCESIKETSGTKIFRIQERKNGRTITSNSFELFEGIRTFHCLVPCLIASSVIRIQEDSLNHSSARETMKHSNHLHRLTLVSIFHRHISSTGSSCQKCRQSIFHWLTTLPHPLFDDVRLCAWNCHSFRGKWKRTDWNRPTSSYIIIYSARNNNSLALSSDRPSTLIVVSWCTDCRIFSWITTSLGKGVPVDYLTWIGNSLPGVIIILAVTWFIMRVLYMRYVNLLLWNRIDHRYLQYAQESGWTVRECLPFLPSSLRPDYDIAFFQILDSSSREDGLYSRR